MTTACKQLSRFGQHVLACQAKRMSRQCVKVGGLARRVPGSSGARATDQALVKYAGRQTTCICPIATLPQTTAAGIQPALCQHTLTCSMSQTAKMKGTPRATDMTTTAECPGSTPTA